MLYFHSFWVGIILSFTGQLPVGTMSITATQIAVQENFRNAWKYSVGVALIEMLYLRIILSGMQWIFIHPAFFRIFNWFTVGIFLTLGVFSLNSARKQNVEKKALLLNNRMDRFFLGASMSALNPAQIPFWFLWSAYLINMGWLKTGTTHFNIYTLGTGIGTVAGLTVYMYGGNWLVRKMKTSNRTLNRIVGIVFIAAAVIQLYHILFG